MAKFNITVEIDYIDEEGNLDQELYDRIVDSVVDKVSKNVTEKIQKSAEDKVDMQTAKMENIISDRLNSLMDEFFETPRKTYDRYGDVIKTDITVKDMLKKACDDFMYEKVDTSGKPASLSSWGPNMTRIEYMIKKAVSGDMETAIKNATDEITKKIKEKVSNEVKMQMGEKLSAFVGLDSIINNKK